MLPDERRGRNNPAMTSSGKGSKNAPVRLSTSGAGKELPETASRTQLRPSEVRECATPYFRVVLRTPMAFFRTAFPHRTSGKNNVTIYWHPVFATTVLNNVLMAWARTCGDVSVNSDECGISVSDLDGPASGTRFPLYFVDDPVPAVMRAIKIPSHRLTLGPSGR
ncbi:hypothetical protein BGY98DRAFT_1182343, partial [Russula aff. rugulosa BPL654]